MAKITQPFDFDFSSLSLLSFSEPQPEKAPVPKLTYQPVAFENAEKMAREIDWNQDYICIVSGTFIFGDFIEALLYRKALKPSVMYIATLGMSENNIDSLVNCVDYLKCKKLNLLVSHYFAGVERHKLIPYMEREFAGRPIDVAVLQSHMKMCIIRSDLGDAAIIGSANLSSSNNVEQFTITHNPETIDFCESRIQNIMDRFTVIKGMDSPKMNWKANKGNTGRNAYHAITKGMATNGKKRQ